MALAIVMFEEGQERMRARQEGALRAAVAGRWLAPDNTWPDIFRSSEDDGTAVPTKDADLTQFTWESPSEASATADLETLMRGARITVPTAPDPAAGKAPPPLVPQPPEAPTGLRPGTGMRPPVPGLPDPAQVEWT